MSFKNKLIFGLILGIILEAFLITIGKVEAAVSWGDAQKIYARLVKVSGIKNAPPLRLVNGDQPNAFTTDKEIQVTRGELLLDTKAGLAGVLGHELSHFRNGDVYHIPQHYHEIRADREGVIMAIKIGYPRCDILEYMRVMKYMYGEGESVAHPKWTLRYNLLKGKCPKIRR